MENQIIILYFFLHFWNKSTQSSIFSLPKSLMETNIKSRNFMVLNSISYIYSHSKVENGYAA